MSTSKAPGRVENVILLSAPLSNKEKQMSDEEKQNLRKEVMGKIVKAR